MHSAEINPGFSSPESQTSSTVHSAPAENSSTVHSTPAEISSIVATLPVETSSASATLPIPSVDLRDLSTCSPPSSLSDDQKYQILTVVPAPLKDYPVNSQKRRFRSQWVEQFSWVRYSVSMDGVFCAPCYLFSLARYNNEFVSSPFRNWKHAVGSSCGKLNRHSESLSHKECLAKAASLIAIMNNKELSIRSRLSEEYDRQVQLNTKALLAIIDCIQFLVKQGLGLRGSEWDKGRKRENGNFSMLIDFLSKYNDELKSHLQNSARNARYLSPKIQNELIIINGDLIRQSIVNECNASLFWSLMADKTSDVSTTEQLSICVRYVRETNTEGIEICEEFVGFCSLPATGAKDITAAIVQFSNVHQLNMSKLVGKGFDGASTMSGHVSGVSTRLKELYPNARYLTHCRNHALNLVVVASCNNVPDIRSFMDTFKSLTLFFKYSPKRKHILREHLKSSTQEDLLADADEYTERDPLEHTRTKYRGLPVLSETRWLARVDSIDCLLRNYKAVCEAVEAVRNSSSGQSANDADSFLNRLLSFEFFVCAVICRHVLGFTRPLTVALQAKDCDLHEAHQMAQRLVKALESERASEKFQKLWELTTAISSDLGLQPEKKRTARVQRNRANPPVEGIQDHYRVAYYFPFLDHTISHLRTRFSPELESALLATYLLPANSSKLSEEIIGKIKSEFFDFLPQSSSFESEVATWKIHMSELTDKAVDLLSTCKLAQENKLFYPNIYAVLFLFLCLPVGSCSCERSFSALRRLKTWCRSSMTGERLDSLSLGYVNHERTFTPEEVLKVWDRSGHRRISLAFRD